MEKLVVKTQQKVSEKQATISKDASKPDFSRRFRKLEWRHQWFHLHRTEDDRQLRLLLDNALAQKRRLMKEQSREARHRAGYYGPGPAPPMAGTPWFSIGPRNVNGRVKSIAVHPSNPAIAYAAAANGGIWKTTDGAQSWRPLWDTQETLSIGSVAIAPSAPDTVYVGTGEWTPGFGASFPGAGVYVSTNAGATWTQRPNVVARRISRILVSPTNANTVYVAGENGFERSTDAGVTWTTIRTGQISDAVIDPANGQTIYVNVMSDGIYKTTNAGTTWNKLVNGPTADAAYWVKLAIGVNGTNATNFLVAKSDSTIYRTTDAGATWTTLVGSHGAGWWGWCDMIQVAPDDESIIVVGGYSGHMERTADGGTTWNNTNTLHADHHVAVFAPSNPTIVYECNDGGVYRSDDKGATWKKASHGLVITQFYDLGAWSKFGTVVGGGTQDQGTNMSTGGLTWRPIFGADGGYLIVHPTDPRTLYAETQYTNIHKSTDGGLTWVQKTGGLSGGTPWVGVMTLDENSPDRLYCGTSKLFRSTNGLATDWVESSQTLAGEVSAIQVAPSDSSRVYASAGSKLYRSDDAGVTNPWVEKAAGLPSRTITDIAVDRANPERLAITMGGTSAGPNAVSVFLTTNGGNTWTDVSGNLPNISANAIALDPNNANTLYVGTDVGVFRTTNLGASWQAFDNGIPNALITDLHLDPEDNLLVAATFGRGMYKVDIAPGASHPAVDLYLRDSILDTGERFPSPSNEANPNDLNDTVHWWESPDIKVDAPGGATYAPDAVFDGVEFDDELTHEDPHRNQANKFYLQLHNRGWQNATNVKVRAFFCDASAGLPNLPADFWTAFPNSDPSDTTIWKPIGPAQMVPLLEPNRPVVVSWEWLVPQSAATHSCLLAAITSGEDAITTAELNVNNLVKAEKRVCLKNLHVVTGSSPRPAQTMVSVDFHNASERDELVDIVIHPTGFGEGNIGLLLERVDFADRAKAFHGVRPYPVRENEDVGKWYDRPGSKQVPDRSERWNRLDRSVVYEFDPTKGSEMRGIRMAPGQTLQGVVTCKGSHKVPYGQTQQFAVMQRQRGEIVGGSTYEVRLARAAGLHPVSHIRVILEKVQILDDHDPWIKGRGEFTFATRVSFNGDERRRNVTRLPENGRYKISDRPSRNVQRIDACIFDGFVAEKDRMRLEILPVEHDLLDPNDQLVRFHRGFEGGPEAWVGRYEPGDEASADDRESMRDWKVWYRVESVKL